MEAVITVVGKDKVGTLAKVCTVCAEHSANVEEVTQQIMHRTFAMIILVNVPNSETDF